MNDLLATVSPPDLREQLAEIDRELAQRRRVYPRFIGLRKLTQDRADYQIRCLEAARSTIAGLSNP